MPDCYSYGQMVNYVQQMVNCVQQVVGTDVNARSEGVSVIKGI